MLNMKDSRNDTFRGVMKVILRRKKETSSIDKSKVPLPYTRGACLLLANLIVLLAGLVTLLAGLDLEETLASLDEEAVVGSSGGVVTKVVWQGCPSYLQPALLVTSGSLIVFWLLHGCFLAARFGCVTKDWVRKVALTHTLVMVIWQVCCSATILRMLVVLNPLTGQERLDRLLMLWGPWLAGLYLACVPVQLATALALVSQGQGKDERVRKKAEADYVPVEKSRRDLAFYITEMPAEKLARLKVSLTWESSLSPTQALSQVIPPSYSPSCLLDIPRVYPGYMGCFNNYIDMED